ncbi:MAG: addiction module protein [Burkholderiales bacterium]|nr:addiction module protein [Burkholderiales bacterium]
MTTLADDLFAEALRLPEGARAALAASLIDSLDATVDADAEAQWAAEIRRRIAALDAGAPTTPWDEARKVIAGS